MISFMNEKEENILELDKIYEYHIIIPDEDWDKYFINYKENE